MESFREWVDQQGYSDQAIISLYTNSPDRKIKEIAQMTGKSVGEIYRILHSYDVSPNRLKTNHQNVINFANFGYNIPQIAQFTGYTERNVRYILSKMNERKNG